MRDPVAVIKQYHNMIWRFASRLWAKSAIVRQGLGSVEDAYQAGVIGVLNGLPRIENGKRKGFRTDKGAKFTTYLGSCIYRSILREASDSPGLIRLPANLCWHADRPEDRERVERAMTISYFSALCRDGSREDRVEPAARPEPSQEQEGNRRELLELMSAKLNERERVVMEGFYGTSEQPKKTLAGLGKVLGISKERVRQIREGALRKLERSSRGHRQGGSTEKTA